MSRYRYLIRRASGWQRMENAGGISLPMAVMQQADGIGFWRATDGTHGWYLFDPEGYMMTGYQKDAAGEAFFLCPDKGSDEGKCMITDARGVLRIAEEYDFDKHRYKFNW